MVNWNRTQCCTERSMSKSATTYIWVQELISLRELISNFRFKVSSNASINTSEHISTPITFICNLRLHTGGTGENAAVSAFTCVHVAIALPTSSKPMLQLWVAVLLTEFPVNVTIPLKGSTGPGHRAA